MITIDQFNKIPYDEIFQDGKTTDNPDGINMNNSGQPLKWIAKKGGGDDWAIISILKVILMILLRNMAKRLMTAIISGN